MKEVEDNTKTTVVKAEKTFKEEVKENEAQNSCELEEVPIALRKSTRSSARRSVAPEPTVSSPRKPTPVTVTSSAKTPKKPEQSKPQDTETPQKSAKKPVSKTKSKNKKKKSNDEKDSDVDSDEDGAMSVSEDEAVASKCVGCSKDKARQVLLLCDGCDAPYHMSCVKPPLLEVPDGDWFCAVCEHDQLVRLLQARVSLIDAHFRELELAKLNSMKKRCNRIADIGANLDNLFGDKKRNKKKAHGDDNDDEDDDEEERERKRARKAAEFSIFEAVGGEPLGPRSCRAKSRVTYTFDEFDRTIKEAVGENVDEEEEEKAESRVEGTRRSLRGRKLATFDSSGEGTGSGEDNEDDRSANSGDEAAKVAPRAKQTRVRPEYLFAGSMPEAMETQLGFAFNLI